MQEKNVFLVKKNSQKKKFTKKIMLVIKYPQKISLKKFPFKYFFKISF